jgi:hypothetical protein
MIDWLDSFLFQFGNYEELQNIKKRKLHGSLTINFCAGTPQNYNLNIHRRSVEMNDKNNNLNEKKTE